MNSEFEKLSLEANESDYNYNSDEIYSEQKEGLRELLNALGEILLFYTISNSILKLTSKEKKDIKHKLFKIVSNSFNNQGKLEEEKMNEILNNSISNNYYKKVYILSLGTDIDVKKLRLDVITNIIDNVVEGKNWTDRIWTNKKELENILKKDIVKFLNGLTDVNDIKTTIEKRFNTNAYVTNRLINNEIARCQFEINDYFANLYGIEQQQFVAILDSRTSKKCRGLDGVIFDINDPSKPKIPQDTHVGCRSCYINIPTGNWNIDTKNNNRSIWKDFSKWYEEKVDI